MDRQLQSAAGPDPAGLHDAQYVRYNNNIHICFAIICQVCLIQRQSVVNALDRFIKCPCWHCSCWLFGAQYVPICQVCQIQRQSVVIALDHVIKYPCWHCSCWLYGALNKLV